MRKILLKYGLVYSLVILSGAILMHISHKVQRVERDIARKSRAIEHEKETIRVLKAEWAYLNDPARLEAIAQNGLGFLSVEVEDLVSSASTIPENPVVVYDVPEADAETPSGVFVASVGTSLDTSSQSSKSSLGTPVPSPKPSPLFVRASLSSATMGGAP